MNRALNPVFARPGDHLSRGGAVFHASQADLAQDSDARCGEFLESPASTIPCSITGRPGEDLLRRQDEMREKARCAKIAMAFSPTMSFGRPGVCTSPAETMVVTPPCR